MIEPDSFFSEEFTEPVTLSKADGSVSVSGRGIYDEASTQFDADGAAMSSFQRQIAVSRTLTLFEEGDTITRDEKETTHDILDVIKDETVVIYLLSPPNS